MNKDSNWDAVWARIRNHQGEIFTQIKGGEFSYSVAGTHIELDRTNQNIASKQLREALQYVPLSDTVPVQHLRGPSYIFAIMMDPRIRGDDW